MTCYWGCGTKRNKVAWALILAFAVIGLALWVPGLIGVRKCLMQLYGCDCTETASGTYVCSTHGNTLTQQCYDDYVQCVRPYGVLWGLGWLFLAFFSWLPCTYFCCCATNPHAPAPGADQGQVYGYTYPTAGPVEMGAYPAPVGGAYPYGQPPTMPAPTSPYPQPVPAPSPYPPPPAHAYPAGGQFTQLAPTAAPYPPIGPSASGVQGYGSK